MSESSASATFVKQDGEEKEGKEGKEEEGKRESVLFLSAVAPPANVSASDSPASNSCACSCSHSCSSTCPRFDADQDLDNVTLLDFASFYRNGTPTEIANVMKSCRVLSFDLPLIASRYAHCFEDVLARDLTIGNDRWTSISLKDLSPQTLDLAMVIISYLALCPAINEINLAGAAATVAEGIHDFLQSSVSRRFSKFSMRNCRLLDEGLAQICLALQDHPQLEEVNISVCGARDLTATALAGLMVANSCVRHVVANANRFSRDSLLCLMRGLAAAPHIRSFKSYFTFTDEPFGHDPALVGAVNQLFLTENCLRIVLIGPFECTDDECDELFGALAQNRTLRQLKLLFVTAMTQKRADCIARALAAHRSLEIVCFGNTTAEEVANRDRETKEIENRVNRLKTSDEKKACEESKRERKTVVEPPDSWESADAEEKKEKDEKEGATAEKTVAALSPSSSTSSSSSSSSTTMMPAVAATPHVDLSALERAIENNPRLYYDGFLNKRIEQICALRRSNRSKANLQKNAN